MAIGNNVPLDRIGCFFHSLCHYLVVEFVPKEDSQVQRLLASREDIFPNYDAENFEKEFERYFNIDKTVRINDSYRTLYLMRRRETAEGS
jgi:hypothetical protein